MAGGSGDAIGSTKIIDFKRNTEGVDEFVNSELPFFVGRALPGSPEGKDILTIEGIYQEALKKVRGAGLVWPPIDYAAGLVVESSARTYRYDGVIYNWVGDIPFTTSGDFEADAQWNVVQAKFTSYYESLTGSELAAQNGIITVPEYEVGSNNYAVFINGTMLSLDAGDEYIETSSTKITVTADYLTTDRIEVRGIDFLGNPSPADSEELGAPIIVDFKMNSNTEQDAEINKQLIDSAIAEAIEKKLPIIMPAKAGDVYIKGSTYLPDGISIKGHGREITRFKPYDTGDPLDYRYTYSDNFKQNSLFHAGTDGKILLPELAKINAGGENIPFKTQIDDKIERGDVLAIYDKRDYSWGNFRRVNNPDGSIDYSQSTGNDDRPYYRAGELAYVRSATSPDVAVIPNSVLIFGTTYDDYEDAPEIIAYKLATHTNHFLNCTIEGIDGEDVAGLICRQLKESVINADLRYGQYTFWLLNCVRCSGYTNVSQPSVNSSITRGIGMVNFSSFDCHFKGSFEATRHAVSHSSSYGIAVPARACTTHGSFRSHRSYAVDFHGAADANKVSGFADGGVVWSGRDNDISDLVVKCSRDGVAVFGSEPSHWNQKFVAPRNIITVRGITSNAGLIHFGGSGYRGFLPNISEDGYFTIRLPDTVYALKDVAGRCNFGLTDATQSECEALGGYYNTETGTCSITDYTGYDQISEGACLAISGASWEENGYQMFRFNGRNLIANLDLRIENAKAKSVLNEYSGMMQVSSLSLPTPYNGIPAKNIRNLIIEDLDGEGTGGALLSSVDNVEVKKISVNGGTFGLRTREIPNLKLGDVGVKNTDFQGLDITNEQGVQPYLEIDSANIENCGTLLTGTSSEQSAVRIDNYTTVKINNKIKSKKASAGADQPLVLGTGVDTFEYYDIELLSASGGYYENKVELNIANFVSSGTQVMRYNASDKYVSSGQELITGYDYILSDSSTYTLPSVANLIEGRKLECKPINVGVTPEITSGATNMNFVNGTTGTSLTLDTTDTVVFIWNGLAWEVSYA